MSPKAQAWFDAVQAYKDRFGKPPPWKWINAVDNMETETVLMQEAVANNTEIQVA